MDRDTLDGVRLAPIATHEPVGTVAYGEDRKSSTNERPGHAMGATAALIALITLIALATLISAVRIARSTGKRRQAKRRKESRRHN
jgi:hypothetical protein